MTSSPLIERLEAVEAYEIVHAGEASPRKYRRPINPDGPEAAALIRELVEALEKARSGLESILPTGYPHPLMVGIDTALSRAKATSND